MFFLNHIVKVENWYTLQKKPKRKKHISWMMSRAISKV